MRRSRGCSSPTGPGSDIDANPVLVIRPLFTDPADPAAGVDVHYVWCPGCEAVHTPRVVHPGRAPGPGVTWGWDGDTEHPTYSPSYLTWMGDQGNPTRRCHSFIRAGRWEFLSDCTHLLAGQAVAMVPVPDWLTRP